MVYTAQGRKWEGGMIVWKFLANVGNTRYAVSMELIDVQGIKWKNGI
jgi:hypothetical protein